MGVSTASTATTDPQSVINGVTYWDQNSGALDSLSIMSNGVLRFEVDKGAHWRYDSSSVQRSEIAALPQVPNGTSAEASYTVTFRQGIVDPDPYGWIVVGQFHQDNNAHAGTPPFALSIIQGKMVIQVSYTDANGNDVYKRIWSDTNTVAYNKAYAMDVKLTCSPSGNGSLVVTRDGVTLVSYTGRLGYASQSSVYWKEGIYRSNSSTSTIVDYSNTKLTIGGVTTSTKTALTATADTTTSSATAHTSSASATGTPTTDPSSDAAAASTGTATPTPAASDAATPVIQAAQPSSSAPTVSSEVALLYQTILGRSADAAGAANYMARIANGASLSAAAASMVGSGEAAAHYGSQTDAQFVSQLFSNAYGAGATSSDNAALASQLVDRLGHGTLSRADAAVGVALASQHLAAAGVTLAGGLIGPSLTATVTTDPHSAGGTAALVALTLLGKSPTGLELEQGSQVIAGGGSASDVAAGLMAGSAASLAAQTDTQFVNTLYENALGRDPDAGGLAHYQAELAGGTSRADVAADIAISQEHVAKVADSLGQGIAVPDASASAMARLYYGVLGRAPDIWGLLSDSHLSQGSGTLTDRANAMLGSSEFKSHYGQLSDTAFVSTLYQNALGRTPDAGGMSTYTGLLGSGTSRATVALDIAESQEATRHLAPQIENGFRLA